MCGGISDGIHGIIVQLHWFIHDEVTDFLPFIVLVLFLDSRVILTPHPECLDVVDTLLDHLVGIHHIVSSVVHLGNDFRSSVVSNDGHILLDAQLIHSSDEVGGGQVRLIDDRLDVYVILAVVHPHQSGGMVVPKIDSIYEVDEPSGSMLHKGPVGVDVRLADCLLTERIDLIQCLISALEVLDLSLDAIGEEWVVLVR